MTQLRSMISHRPDDVGRTRSARRIRTPRCRGAIKRRRSRAQSQAKNGLAATALPQPPRAKGRRRSAPARTFLRGHITAICASPQHQTRRRYEEDGVVVADRRPGGTNLGHASSALAQHVLRTQAPVCRVLGIDDVVLTIGCWKRKIDVLRHQPTTRLDIEDQPDHRLQQLVTPGLDHHR